MERNSIFWVSKIERKAFCKKKTDFFGLLAMKIQSKLGCDNKNLLNSDEETAKIGFQYGLNRSLAIF